jgi:4-alpha-glucanotransferase
MALHRLFWIPTGFEAAEGVYVRCPAEELYALLAIESHRHGCLVVGEDLGTVPSYVRPAMRRHGVKRSYVLQCEARPDPVESLPPADVDAVAALNTHDMPTFAAFWDGLDIPGRVERGLLDQGEVAAEREERERVKDAVLGGLRRGGWLEGGASGVGPALAACVAFLGDSRAGIVLVGLEDLWLETEPQNRPGSGPEKPNWKRKARHPLEALTSLPQTRRLLRELDGRRKRETGEGRWRDRKACGSQT